MYYRRLHIPPIASKTLESEGFRKSRFFKRLLRALSFKKSDLLKEGGKGDVSMKEGPSNYKISITEVSGSKIFG
jgi:hypothetical protein